MPRFTTMLRTFASQHLGAAGPDAAAQFLARAALLEQKRRQRSDAKVGMNTGPDVACMRRFSTMQSAPFR